MAATVKSPKGGKLGLFADELHGMSEAPEGVRTAGIYEEDFHGVCTFNAVCSQSIAGGYI